MATGIFNGGHAHVNWPRALGHVEIREPLDFFLRLFPMAFVATILRHTNAEIERRREIIVQDRNVEIIRDFAIQPIPKI